MSLTAPTISIIGPEECGKSTLIGYFMYSLFKKATAHQQPEHESEVPAEDQMEIVFADWWEKAIRMIESGPWSKSEARFAYLVDTFDHERSVNNLNKTMTKDLNFIQMKVGGVEHPLTLVNVPGHFRFWTKISSAGGISDYIILMVDAKKYEKDYTLPSSDILKKMPGGSYNEFPRGILCAALSAFITYTKIFVVISKMDLLDYKEDSYNEICRHVADQIEALGVNKNAITFLPIAIDRTDAIGHNILKGDTGSFDFKETKIISFQECLANIRNTEAKAGNEDKLIIDVIPRSAHHSMIMVKLRAGKLYNGMEVKCFPVSKKEAPFDGKIEAVWEPYRTGREFPEAKRIERPEDYPVGSIFAIKIKGLSEGMHLQAMTEKTFDLNNDYILTTNITCFVITSMLCEQIKKDDKQKIEILSRGYVGEALVRKVSRFGAAYDLPEILKMSEQAFYDRIKTADNDILSYYDVGLVELELLNGPMFISLNVTTEDKAVKENRGAVPFFFKVSEKYGVLPFSVISLRQYALGAVGRIIGVREHS